MPPKKKKRRTGLAAASQLSGPLPKVLPHWWETDKRQKLKEEYDNAKPFPHAALRPLCDADAMRRARAELERLGAEPKETDLFKFYQTQDLGSILLPSDGSKAPPELDALSALAAQLYSKEFKTLIEQVTGCGTLSDRVDMAAQVYSRGCHLLCHDDVIGTRKISFIVYLTEPAQDWRLEEGGVLELYESDAHAERGVPGIIPVKAVLPLFNSLAIFGVQPGISYHAVRELTGERARLSIQGWYHAPSLEETLGFEDRCLATLSQITKQGGAPTPINDSAVVEESVDAFPEELGNLSEEDIQYLSQWLAPEYLLRDSHTTIVQRFADDSYVALKGFLRADHATKLNQLLLDMDKADDLRIGVGTVSEDGPVPAYSAGLGLGWKFVGPPHMQRYVRFGKDLVSGSAGCCSAEGSKAQPDESCPPRQELGKLMSDIAECLFQRPEFARLILALTGLAPRKCTKAEVRRFRPGMDYTVATHLGITERAELNVTFCVVDDSCREAQDAWVGEDVGGFESYIAVDEAGESAEAQERYRADDSDGEGGPLLNIPASSNTLSIVVRDAGTMQFVKYLASRAPSSRVDVVAAFDLDADAVGSVSEDDDQDDDQEGED